MQELHQILPSLKELGHDVVMAENGFQALLKTDFANYVFTIIREDEACPLLFEVERCLKSGMIQVKCFDFDSNFLHNVDTYLKSR